MRFLVVSLVGFLAPAIALAQAGEARILAGEATVLDGDTLLLNGERVRLHGIAAAEMSDWPWGPFARAALDEMAHGKQVSCIVIDTDRYKRAIARCTLPGDPAFKDKTLGEAMIRSGWATHHRLYTHGVGPKSIADTYDAAERQAQEQEVGIWGVR